MKKSRRIGLLLLYIVIFLSVIGLQIYAMQNTERRLWVNLVASGIAVVGGILFWLLLRSSDENSTQEDSSIEKEKPVSKETYLAAMSERHLTRRELEVGFLLVSGYSNQRIAQELFISETTVKKHVSHIYEKTNVQSRKEFKKMCLF